MDYLIFEKPDDVGKWLMERPPDWAQVIAVRVALRVFPLVLNGVSTPGDEIEPELVRNLELQSFRAVFVSWVSCLSRKSELSSFTAYEAASNAINAISRTVSGQATVELAAAVSAAKAAAYSTHFDIASVSASDIAEAASLAADAAASSVDQPGAGELVLRSVSADCQRLAGQMKPDELIHQPIWPEELRESAPFQNNLPEWSFRAFAAFLGSDWGSTDAGELIGDWYQSLVPLEGSDVVSSFGSEADLAVAVQPPEFWTPSEERDVEQIWNDIVVLRQGGTLEPLPKREKQEVTSESEETSSAPPIPSPENIRVAVQFDQYARTDELGRKRFAEILATRISEIHEGGGPDGLAVNLHAPWGAGKTTVLHFMKGFLEDPGLPPEKRWVVVEFNAWQHEHRRPPWWPFLQIVKSQLSDGLTGQQRRTRAGEVRHAWNLWRFQADAPPYVALGLIGVLLMMLFWAGSSDVAKNLVGTVGTVITIFGAIAVFSRKAFFGSEKSANLFHDYASDPLEKLSILFKDMIEAADAPVCIFVDDLDRCSNDFVVEFLEGLQTSFRHRKVAYVVAADKFWIKTSFEDRYPSFCEKTADKTQPLGYQFLEKIFQFNVPLPGMAAWKKRYLEARLGLAGTGDGATGSGGSGGSGAGGTGNGTGNGTTGNGTTGTGPGEPGTDTQESMDDKEVERLRGEIRSTQPGGLTHETVRTLSTGDGSDNPAFQAALALEYTTSRTAQREAEHFLFQYLALLPDNPRVIKRIINAFGLTVASAILERQSLDYDVLTRWTILEQCYPAVADELIRDPELADTLLAVEADKPPASLPAPLIAFCEKKNTVNLLKSGENPVLTQAVVKRLTRGLDVPAPVIS
ncbi:KAP family P-loop NTPase fold protein [Roseibium sp. M-1]